MAAPQQEKKKSSRREERLKFSAGESGTGVLIGCALIAAGIGVAFFAHTARNFSNRGKSSRRNCRKDDHTDQEDQSVDRIDTDTVDYLGNACDKSEIMVKPNFEGLEIMAKLEQDVKIPPIKFCESNEGKGVEGLNAERLWSAEVIEQEMKHILEEPETDSSVSSQRDILTTESEESEENFEMAIITRERELGHCADGDRGHNSSILERIQDIQKTSNNSEIAMDSLHRKHKRCENSGVFIESQILDNMENASVLVQERSFHNAEISMILRDETNQNRDEEEREAPVMRTEGSERRGISSMEPNDNGVHPTDLVDQVMKVSETVNAIKEEGTPIKFKKQEIETPVEEELVSVEKGSERAVNTSTESNDYADRPAESIDQVQAPNLVNATEEEASPIKCHEQEKGAPFVEEHVIVEEGMKGSRNYFMESNGDVHPIELVDLVKVSESVNVNIQQEEGSPIMSKMQEREASVEEENVIVEEHPEGLENCSMESNDAVHPAVSIDKVQASNLFNATEEERSPIKCKEQEREAPVVEDYVRVQEGSEATGNIFEESNDNTIYPAELNDQLKVSESDAKKEEEEEEEGSLIKPKEQERQVPVEEEHVTIEEGTKGSTNSFMESSDDVIHPVELVDLVEVPEEEGSPIISKVQEREAPVEEELVIVEEGSEGIENYSMVSNSKTIHPAEGSDQVKVPMLVNVNNKEEEDNDNKGSPIKSKGQEREASDEEEQVRVDEGLEKTENSFMESNKETTRPAELTDQMKVSESTHLLPCTNQEQGESSVDSSTTIQETTCEDAETVVETYETRNGDIISEAVQESVDDIDIGNVVAKEFSTHDIFRDQEKPDLEKPDIANVQNISKKIPENERKPFTEEVGDKDEGSEVVGDSSVGSYRVFILVLMALGVALGLLAFAHPDNIPNIYQQLSRLLFPSDHNDVGEL